jgi:hypothetical protein
MQLSPGGRSRTLRAGCGYRSPLPSFDGGHGSRSSVCSIPSPLASGCRDCRRAGIVEQRSSTDPERLEPEPGQSVVEARSAETPLPAPEASKPGGA